MYWLNYNDYNDILVCLLWWIGTSVVPFSAAYVNLTVNTDTLIQLAPYSLRLMFLYNNHACHDKFSEKWTIGLQWYSVKYWTVRYAMVQYALFNSRILVLRFLLNFALTAYKATVKHEVISGESPPRQLLHNHCCASTHSFLLSHCCNSSWAGIAIRTHTKKFKQTGTATEGWWLWIVRDSSSGVTPALEAFSSAYRHCSSSGNS